jgi:uncharacterized protein (TIGR00661 family)
MKILYSASNNANAKLQLSRFLRVMDGTKHTIKIAAYKQSFPKNRSVDWCLDALLNIYKPELLSLNNDNLGIYFQQIKSFAPDLIISDLEYFTSYLAHLANIQIWQCSSSIINFALSKEDKYNLGLFKFYAHSLNRDPQHTQRTANIIQNSDRKMVYSHFGDVAEAPKLHEDFEWVRPYHQVYKIHAPCQHNVVAGLSKNNKQILDQLRKYSDSVVFMDVDAEKYQNLHVKDIDNEDEYYCNLRNCNYFVCQGQATFLADAFYNEQISLIYPDYEDTESIINSQLSKKLSLGDIPYPNTDISAYNTFEAIQPTYNNHTKYLHEAIEAIQ